MDKIPRNKRSEIMSKVKSKDSGIEIDFRRKLWREGFRFRKNSAKYFGCPDIVFPRLKIVIFIDSCFWHGCKRHFRLPLSNREYWLEKIKRNIWRDKEVSKYYKNRGWEIFRIWEHDLNKAPNRATKSIIDKIRKIKEKLPLKE